MSAPLLRAVASLGLDAADPVRPSRPLADDAWRRSLRAVRAEGLLGLLAFDVALGAWPVTDPQRDELYRLHRDAMARCLVLERLLVELGTPLTDAGVRWRVLKGSANAHLDYLDPALRSFRDLDLLVHRDDLDLVHRTLVARGATRRYPEPRPGYDRRFGKGACFVLEGGWQIDVHRTLADGYFGMRIDPQRLVEGAGESFELGGVEVRALDRPSRFVHACYHAALGSVRPPLLALRDVAQTAPRDADESAAVSEVADSWRGGAVVVRSIEMAQRLLSWSPAEVVVELSGELAVSRGDTKRLAAYQARSAAPAARAFGALPAIDGTLDRLRYSVAIALPGRSRRGHVERWRRGVRSPRVGRGRQPVDGLASTRGRSVGGRF